MASTLIKIVPGVYGLLQTGQCHEGLGAATCVKELPQILKSIKDQEDISDFIPYFQSGTTFLFQLKSKMTSQKQIDLPNIYLFNL